MDKNKVKAFISESQILNHSKSQHIDGVLNKSQFWEDRLKSFNVSSDMKERMMQMKDQKSLFLLRNHFEDHTKKEMEVLQRKQSDLYRELNIVMNTIKKQKKLIAQQQSVLNNMPTAGELSHIDLEEQLNLKKASLENIIMQLKQYGDFKDRMERVIHVCEINKIQNEDWIRNLNFYKSNLQTVTNEMKVRMESLQKQMKMLEDKEESIRDDYNQKKGEHLGLLQEIQNELDRKSYVDALIRSTDQIISQSVQLKKMEVEDMMTNQLNQDANHKKAQLNQQMKKKIYLELDQKKEEFEKISFIFEAGENGESWEQKDQVEKMVNAIDRRKELEFKELNIKLQIDLTKQNCKGQKEILATLKKAQVGAARKSNSQLSEANERTLKLIEEEKQKIAENNEYLSSTTLVEDQTNLYVNSVARMLGMIGIDNELKILSERDTLEDLRDKMKDIVHDLTTKLQKEELDQLLKGEGDLVHRIMTRIRKRKVAATGTLATEESDYAN